MWRDICLTSPTMKYLTPHLWLRVGICVIVIAAISPECRDKDISCGSWVSTRQCQLDPEVMQEKCVLSCQNPCVCNVTTEDTACDCKARAFRGECDDNTTDTQSLCPTTCFNTTYQDCDPLPPPKDQHASLTTAQTQYLTLVQELCHFGYRPGVSVDKGRKICVENGVWLEDHFYGKSVVCKLIDCKAPPVPANALVSVNTTLYQDKANYTCALGYQRTAGGLTLTCGTYSWTGTPPTCSAITCPTLPTVENAAMTYSGVTVNATVTYSCLPGSNHVTGSLTRTCDLTGSWTGQTPQCKLVECPLPPTPGHTEVEYSATHYAAVVSYTCLPGYDHVTGNLNRTCMQTGRWSGTLPACEIKDCGVPEQGVHASADVSVTTYAAYVNYSCDVGFRLTSGNVTRRCQDDGGWSGLPVTCQLVDCGDPGSVANAEVDVSNTTYGHNATYTCLLGYRSTSGDVIKTCMASGNWSTSDPVCELVDCGEPPSVAHAELEKSGTTYGHDVSFRCTLGYRHTSGDLLRTCTETGSWSGDAPTCTIVDCGEPPSSSRADVQVTSTTYGSYVTYVCQLGYFHASGDLVRMCQSDGSWFGTTPLCQIVECPPPPQAPHARASYPSRIYLAQVTYLCDVGYRAVEEGNYTGRCMASAAWDVRTPNCTIVECEEPLVEKGALANVSGLQYGARVEYECFYPVDGQGDSPRVWTRTCGPEGIWLGDRPECSELGRKRQSFTTPPKEASGAVGVGIVAIGIVCAVAALIVALDIITIQRHLQFMRENVADWRERWRARLRRRGRSSHVVDPDVHSSPGKTPEGRGPGTSGSDINVSLA